MLAALQRQMTMRVELDADHAFFAGNHASAFEEIALAVVVTLCDHGAVQMEDNAIDRAGSAQLIENLIAHAFVGSPRCDASGLGGIAGAFDQREALRCSALARDPQRRCLMARIVRVLPWRKVELFNKGTIGGRHRRKRVGLESKSRSKQSHRCPHSLLEGEARLSRAPPKILKTSSLLDIPERHNLRHGQYAFEIGAISNRRHPLPEG